MSRTGETVRAIRAIDSSSRESTQMTSEAQGGGQQQTDEAAAAAAALALKHPPVFNTHSQAIAGRLIAEERALKEIVADLDAKIAALNAERTDAMLAESGITAALQALQHNR